MIYQPNMRTSVNMKQIHGILYGIFIGCKINGYTKEKESVSYEFHLKDSKIHRIYCINKILEMIPTFYLWQLR